MTCTTLTVLLCSPTAINAAATWDKKLILARGKAMGEEHRGKGVNVALSPMANMGRVAAGGRNWEVNECSSYGFELLVSDAIDRDSVPTPISRAFARPKR